MFGQKNLIISNISCKPFVHNIVHKICDFNQTVNSNHTKVIENCFKRVKYSGIHPKHSFHTRLRLKHVANHSSFTKQNT